MSFMKGDLLSRTRRLVKGLAKAEPVWLKAMEQLVSPFLHSVISLLFKNLLLNYYYVEMTHLCINLEFIRVISLLRVQDENMPVMLVAALNFCFLGLHLQHFLVPRTNWYPSVYLRMSTSRSSSRSTQSRNTRMLLSMAFYPVNGS